MKITNTGNRYKNIPIFKDEVDYGNLKKLSHRRRKDSKIGGSLLPCLECGNAAIVLQFVKDQKFYWELESWWEERSSEKDFNVELIKDIDKIELRIMTKECYYTSSKNKYNSILNDIRGSVSKYLKGIPVWITGSCEMIILSDWDMLDYVEELVEVI
jgi:hypothetical protein